MERFAAVQLLLTLPQNARKQHSPTTTEVVMKDGLLMVNIVVVLHKEEIVKTYVFGLLFYRFSVGQKVGVFSTKFSISV